MKQDISNCFRPQVRTMRRSNPALQLSAETFATKFGFVTRDLFFEFFCPTKRTQQYEHFNRLVKVGAFVRSDNDQNLLYLSSRRRRSLPVKAVPARFPSFIKHDTDVARFLLLAERGKFVSRSWTEQELAIAPWDAQALLGSELLAKLPDLLIDLTCNQNRIRIAIEIERTRKSRMRLDRIASSYLGMKSVDLVIYGCETDAIASELKRAFGYVAFRDSDKGPVYFQTSALRRNGLDCEAEVFGRRETLRELLLKLAPSDAKREQNPKPDDNRTVVRLFQRPISEDEE